MLTFPAIHRKRLVRHPSFFLVVPILFSLSFLPARMSSA